MGFCAMSFFQAQPFRKKDRRREGAYLEIWRPAKNYRSTGNGKVQIYCSQKILILPHFFDGVFKILLLLLPLLF